jgi:hypothetical protein
MAEEVYHEAGQTSCIMTRLDDCCSLGPALSFLIRQQLPLAYTTNGPHIPQDLSTASGPDFVDHALRKMEASEREADRLQQMDQEVFTGQFSATQFSSNYSASSEQVAKKAMSDLTDMKHRKEVALNMVMDI